MYSDEVDKLQTSSVEYLQTEQYLPLRQTFPDAVQLIKLSTVNLLNFSTESSQQPLRLYLSRITWKPSA